MLKFSFSTLVFLSLAAPSARADAIRLQVLGPDKKPVAGAFVRVLEYDGYQPDRKAVALDLVSDGDGKIAFESKQPLSVSDPKTRTIVTEKNYHAISARVLAPGLALATPVLHAGDNSVTLDAGAKFGGAVFDAEQHPVAGVKIVARSFVSQEPVNHIYLQGALRLETESDAAGKWSFDCLPRAGTMQIEAVDPRFVRELVPVSLGAGGAPPLFLERGATIKGRLLQPDGTPAAGVPLLPGARYNISSDDSMVTAPDGTFELFGLRAGDFYVQHGSFRSREVLPFIVPQQQVKALKFGEIRDIGDLKTETGVVATGKLIESGTQTPVVGASIYFFQNGSFSAQTDENGVFTVRVSRETQSGNISARGFVSAQPKLPKAVGERIEVGTIELKRGLVVKGTLKDQTGRALSLRQVSVQNQGIIRDFGISTYSDGNGQWTLDGLAPGSYSLKVEGKKLVAEVTVVMVAGKEIAPIAAVVQTDLEVSKNASKKLAGIALDGAGKPVAGVSIEIQMKQQNSAQTINAVSGVDGRFEGESFLQDAVPSLVLVSRPGLLLAGGGEFKVLEGVWQTELQFAPRGQVLRGRVVDAMGKPVPRAWVAASTPILGGTSRSAKIGGALPIAQSDDNGAFALVDAGNGRDFLVSDGRSYDPAAMSANGDVTMTAPKSANLDTADTDATALQILPDARFGDYTSIDWDVLWPLAGDARLEAALIRSNLQDGDVQWTWYEYLRQMGRRDPKMLVARGDELEALAPEPEPHIDFLMARFRARSNDAVARQKAQFWLDKESKQQLAITADSVTELLRMASVANGLKAGEGAKNIEFAAQIAAQLSEKARSAGASAWGQLAATIDEPTLNALIADWGDRAKFNALRGALAFDCRAGDLPAARAMLARVEAAQAAAEAAPAQVQYETEYSVEKPAIAVAQARADVAELLALSDPQAAWELSKTATASGTRQSTLLLAIARNAVRLNQLPLAAQALRAVAALPNPVDSGFGLSATAAGTAVGTAAGTAAKAARIALTFDAKLADELFAAMREAARAPVNEFGQVPTIAHYAGARATVAAGETRILLEREWASRIKGYKAPSQDDFYDNSADPLQPLIGAMARVDARRALEMVEQLPEKGSGRAMARGKIVMALLAK